MISGFTFMRNTSSLYYPFVESIQSVLPIVDEFVIAMGDNLPGDQTETMIRAIASDKIKILQTVWDTDKYKHGTIYAQQTELAKNACKGEWLFYLQSDEVVHESQLDLIEHSCRQQLNNKKVEGFLFKYRHFWGDYRHYMKSHVWYPREIRIIRNLPDIHSWGDAQSFKYIPGFTGDDFRTKTNARKLNVMPIEAWIYHYGWVRPPRMMQAKGQQMDSYYHDKAEVEAKYAGKPVHFDYGCLYNIPEFKETHPAVMNEFISKFNWANELHYNPDYVPQRPPLKHESPKYRLLSWIEQHLLGGSTFFGYSNWKIIK